MLAPAAIAPGAVLRPHVAAADRLEQRIDGRWVTRPHAFRAPGRTGEVRLRVRRPDGSIARHFTVRVRPVRLDAVGDVNLGDAPGIDMARHGARYPWTEVGPTLRRADLAVANLECAVSVGGTPWPKATTFRADPAVLPAMRQAGGIDVVTMANNHADDFGDTALLDGLHALRQAGIAPVGAGPDAASAARPAYLTRLGLKIAFVGFSVVPPRSFAATDGSPGVAWGLPDRVRRAIHTAAARSDVVVAYFHWGREGQVATTAAQRVLARVALAAGATVVLGAHPHVLQTIRRSRGRLVAYSLGNLVFAPRGVQGARTGILHIALGRHRVLAARLQPAEIVGTRPRPRH